ncbi:MAG: type II toxin-antitoxin system VapC family toxin [Betaproteobacteria bacterium]|nr:MAG: type II toxin-antitoxin system VapC family toxin [Betaproteobacteria bacterium]
MRRPPASLERRVKVCIEANEPVAMSAVVYAEIRSGIAIAGNPQRHVESFGRLRAWLPVDDWTVEAAEAYTDICAALKPTGNLIGAMDMLIAAHALALGATLVTNNEKEFGRVPGLKVENWTK